MSCRSSHRVRAHEKRKEVETRYPSERLFRLLKQRLSEIAEVLAAVSEPRAHAIAAVSFGPESGEIEYQPKPPINRDHVNVERKESSRISAPRPRG
jgi:hypothetical protein